MAAKKAQKQQQAEVAAMKTEGARRRKVWEEEGVATANTQGETTGAATYVTPLRPRPPHTHTYPPAYPPVAPALLCRHQPPTRSLSLAPSHTLTPTLRVPAIALLLPYACHLRRATSFAPIIVGPGLLLVGRGGHFRLVTLSPRYLPHPRPRSRGVFW